MGYMGQSANAFADNFMKSYLGVQANNRAKEESAQNKMLREAQLAKLNNDLLAEQQAKEQIGNLMEQANPEIMATLNRPAVPQQGQFDINQAMPQRTPQQFATGLMNQPPSPIQTEQPWIAAQPAMRNEQGIANLRQGQAPQGMMLNRPSREQLIDVLMNKDLEKGLQFSKDKTSVGEIQAGILTKFLDGKKLSKAEEAIKNKYFDSGKDTYGDVRKRWKGKVDAFEASMGRKATTDEKRRLFVADPYGILAPSDNENPSQTPTPKYSQTATDEDGNKMGWDGKEWVMIK